MLPQVAEGPGLALLVFPSPAHPTALGLSRVIQHGRKIHHRVTDSCLQRGFLRWEHVQAYCSPA